MEHSEAEDAGGLTPAKDDNEAAHHFIYRTLLLFMLFGYKSVPPPRGRSLSIYPAMPFQQQAFQEVNICKPIPFPSSASGTWAGRWPGRR